MNKWYKYVSVLFVGLCTSLIVRAQTLDVSVSVPINGNYTFVGNTPGTMVGAGDNQLFVTNTYTGATQIMVENSLFLTSPVLNSSGDTIAFGEPSAISILEDQVSSQLLTQPLVFEPQDWSPSGDQILYISYDSQSTPATQQLSQWSKVIQQ